MVECYHLVFNASFKEQYCLCVDILYFQQIAMKMMGECSCLLFYAPSAKANMKTLPVMHNNLSVTGLVLKSRYDEHRSKQHKFIFHQEHCRRQQRP